MMNIIACLPWNCDWKNLLGCSIEDTPTNSSVPSCQDVWVFGGPSNTSVLNCHDVWGLEGGP